MNKDSYVYTIVFTFVLTAFFATILAVTQAYFLPAITENETKVERKAILKVLGLPEDALPTFDEQVVPALASDLNIYATLDADGEPLGYAFPLDGQGLWGSIRGYIGISAEFDRLLGLEFIEQNETPAWAAESMKPGTKSSLQEYRWRKARRSPTATGWTVLQVLQAVPMLCSASSMPPLKES